MLPQFMRLMLVLLEGCCQRLARFNNRRLDGFGRFQYGTVSRPNPDRDDVLVTGFPIEPPGPVRLDSSDAFSLDFYDPAMKSLEDLFIGAIEEVHGLFGNAETEYNILKCESPQVSTVNAIAGSHPIDINGTRYYLSLQVNKNCVVVGKVKSFGFRLKIGFLNWVLVTLFYSLYCI
ncbi:hypothetical protein AKJ16_DCAP13928 [Drosera capensis]